MPFIGDKLDAAPMLGIKESGVKESGRSTPAQTFDGTGWSRRGERGFTEDASMQSI